MTAPRGPQRSEDRSDLTPRVRAVPEIRVAAQPGTDYAELLVRDCCGVCELVKHNRSKSGVVRVSSAMALSKHQQIALRDWLNERWPK